MNLRCSVPDSTSTAWIHAQTGGERMKRQMSVASLLVATVVGLGLVASAGADNRGKRQEVVRARLLGLSEVPSQSVQSQGSFRAVIDEDAGTITYSLSYTGLAPTQSHLHLG